MTSFKVATRGLSRFGRLLKNFELESTQHARRESRVSGNASPVCDQARLGTRKRPQFAAFFCPPRTARTESGRRRYLCKITPRYLCRATSRETIFAARAKSCLGATDPQHLRGGSARPISSSPSETRSLHLEVTTCRPPDDTRGGIGDFWHKSANAGGDVVCVEDLLHTVVVCQRHSIASLIFDTGKGSLCRPR